MLASNLTRVTLDEDRVISLDSIRVNHILISNATITAVECVFKNKNNENILNITVPAQDSFPYNVIWIADKGLKVDGLGDIDVVVTVAHSAIGV